MVQTLSVDELWMFLRSLGYAEDKIKPRDSKFVVWPREFILGELAGGFTQFKKDIGIDVYETDENDCEDSSDWFVVYAKLTHRRSPGRPPRTSPAIGTFDYARGQFPRRERHCINCAVVRSVGGLELVHVEPQVSLEANLTNEERASLYEMRF